MLGVTVRWLMAPHSGGGRNTLSALHATETGKSAPPEWLFGSNVELTFLPLS